MSASVRRGAAKRPELLPETGRGTTRRVVEGPREARAGGSRQRTPDSRIQFVASFWSPALNLQGRGTAQCGGSAGWRKALINAASLAERLGRLLVRRLFLRNCALHAILLQTTT